MQHLVDKILRILKEHVRQNNLEIELNKEDIKRILSDEFSYKSNEDLEYKKSLNHELLQENDDFINLQLQLSEFMDKYGHLISGSDEFNDENDKAEVDEDRLLPYFDQTIEGVLKFEPGHPQFHNVKFFQELLRYYEDKEDYEMCDYLIKIKTTFNQF